MIRFRLLLAVGFATALVAGCGYGRNDRVPVRGTVTFDGTPVDRGTITFVPTVAEAGASQARVSAEIKDGQYVLPSGRGPVPGTYRAEVTWNKKTGKKVQVPGDAGNMIDETRQVIPARFNASTTLTAEVRAEANTIDYALKSR